MFVCVCVCMILHCTKALVENFQKMSNMVIKKFQKEKSQVAFNSSSCLIANLCKFFRTERTVQVNPFSCGFLKKNPSHQSGRLRLFFNFVSFCIMKNAMHFALFQVNLTGEGYYDRPNPKMSYLIF